MYEEDWAEYRSVRNRFWALWVLFIPVGGGLAWLAMLVFGYHEIIFVLPIGYAVVWLYYGGRLQLFRCPRCGEWFSATWWYNLSFLARNCVHCRLKKFSTEP